MYYKITELESNNLNITQIALTDSNTKFTQWIVYC